ncbi:MAG: DegQ family serine endoprotease [Rhodospirillales bacterium]|nr:DegQ family serine endoprotease [Rhodospirillales bacterium]
MLRRTFAHISLALVLVFAMAGTLSAAVPSLDPERGVMTMAPLLEETTPAVVNISVRVRAPGQDNPLLRDPFFRRFFDVPEQMPRREAMSAGSGVIVDAEEGYVLTNHHVVERADRITVTLKDERQFEAELVGSDSETDIALLKIEPDGLQDLDLGDSDALKVGDIVFAIGNPFGLGQTVTSGIVSALGRGLGMRGYEDFIQTDAPINPGNSGGALVNTKGELIGINTAIIGPGGGNVGIGFAVPADMARAVMEQLIEFGEVRRGRLGISIQDLTPDIAEALGLDTARGVVVSQVEPDSAADTAGLEPGDVIVKLDGEPLRDASDLRNRVGLARVGTTVELTLIRDGQQREVKAQVGKATAAAAGSGEIEEKLVGAAFRDLEPGMPQYGKLKGVLVASVDPGSPAWRYGLREGDVVLAVNREPVKSVAELRDSIGKSGRALALSVARGSTQLFIIIR